MSRTSFLFDYIRDERQDQSSITHQLRYRDDDDDDDDDYDDDCESKCQGHVVPLFSSPCNQLTYILYIWGIPRQFVQAETPIFVYFPSSIDGPKKFCSALNKALDIIKLVSNYF